MRRDEESKDCELREDPQGATKAANKRKHSVQNDGGIQRGAEGPFASARKIERGNESEKERTAKDASTRKRSSDGDGITKREGPVKRGKGEMG